MSRRAALSLVALGVVSTSATSAAASVGPARRARDATHRPANPIVLENHLEGDDGWQLTATRTADDVTRQIQGYASRTSVAAGESLDFHISVAGNKAYSVSVYRLGHYGGAGGRLLFASGPMAGQERPIPATDGTTGLIACDWPVSWTLPVPPDWTSGYFLAVFETEDGFRSCTPFVVRDDAHRADFLVVVPFSTYQAYNFWPADGRTARNLYKGYVRPGQVGGIPERAFQVSFDRPYSSDGMPQWCELDIAAVRWLESNGFDVAYASSVDLHEQRVRPERYATLVFPGHDEYWSKAMRDIAESAVDGGTHLAFLAANNIYWHIRFDPARDGRRNRVVTCYKDAPDPGADEHGPTKNWRKIGKRYSRAEQQLLGVQYNGMLADPIPLVIRKSRHWFWSGTGLRDGDTVDGLVAVEADGWNRKIELSRRANQTLLSDTPYEDRLGRGTRVQNTSLYETRAGTLVFSAATFHWCLALVDSPYTDARIQKATKNLFQRMLALAGT